MRSSSRSARSTWTRSSSSAAPRAGSSYFGWQIFRGDCHTAIVVDDGTLGPQGVTDADPGLLNLSRSILSTDLDDTAHQATGPVPALFLGLLLRPCKKLDRFGV